MKCLNSMILAVCMLATNAFAFDSEEFQKNRENIPDIKFTFQRNIAKPIELRITEFKEDKSGNVGFVHLALDAGGRRSLRFFRGSADQELAAGITRAAYYIESRNGNQTITQYTKDNDLDRLLMALRSASKNCPVIIKVDGDQGNFIREVKPTCDWLSSSGAPNNQG